MNRQIPTGKIFIAHVSDKRLESKIHKEFLQIEREKQTTQLKIWISTVEKNVYEWPVSSKKVLNVSRYQRNTAYSQPLEMLLHIH